MDGGNKVQKAYESLFSHDFAKAAEWFEQAIEDDPNNASLHYKLSITYARNNKLHKATQYAENAVRFDPYNVLYQSHLQRLEAQSYMRQAETFFDGTTESLYNVVYLLRQAIRLDPIAMEGYLMLAQAYGGLEDYFQAVQTAKEAVRLVPDDELAQQLLAKYIRKLNEQLRK